MFDSPTTRTTIRRPHLDHHRAARGAAGLLADGGNELWATGGLSPDHARLGRRLELARRSAFVGREEHLAAFRAALTDAVGAPFVFLHGAGGSGKTALLHRFADEAVRAGRPVVRPGAAGASRSGAAGLGAARAGADVPASELVRALVPAAHGRADPVVLIDDYDDWRPLEPWLRERLLPALPLRSVVVLAGRTPPGLEWTTDPGWRELLRVHEVRDLPAGDAVRLLDRGAVPLRHHARLLTLTDGHPLALRVAIDALTAGRPVEEVPLAVAHAVLQRVVAATPTPAHRHALELCAASEVVTESDLGAAEGPRAGGDTGGADGGGDDATELFRWLGSLPYVDRCPGGLRLRPVVRAAITAERRWRDPEPATPPPAIPEPAIPPSADAVGGAGRASLPRDEFDAAVRAALHAWRRPDLLATNPLVTSRLVARSAASEPVDGLRAALRSALDQLGQDPRQSKGHRALVATYLSGAPTQEAAAERLSLPFSTYRRHLARGLAALLGLLWWQENRRGDPRAEPSG